MGEPLDRVDVRLKSIYAYAIGHVSVETIHR